MLLKNRRKIRPVPDLSTKVPGVDLLVAYPLSSPNLRRLAELVSSHAGEVRISVLCEDAPGVAATPDVLNIWLDVNPLGYNRTGAPAHRGWTPRHSLPPPQCRIRFLRTHASAQSR